MGWCQTRLDLRRARCEPDRIAEDESDRGIKAMLWTSLKFLAASAQPCGKRCFAPVGNEVVARAHAVVDEVKGMIVKYSILHDEIVLRHISGESREYGDVGSGDDDDTSGERHAIDNTDLTTRAVREHPVRTKHD